MSGDRPVEDRDQVLGGTTAVAALLERLLYHGHVLKCGSKSCRAGGPAVGEAMQLSTTGRMA